MSMDITTTLQSLIGLPSLGAGIGALIGVFVLVCLLKGGRRRRPSPSLRRTLTAIRRTTLEPRAVLNLSERKLHRELSRIVGQSRTHTLLAQVSMGEFLRARDARTSRSRWQTVFNAFNAKRVDFLIVDADWLPCIAVEYQGKGHYQGNARARDAIKRAVCERAGITFMEVASAGLTPCQTRDLHNVLSARGSIAAE